MLDDAWWWLNETDADGFRVDAAKHMNFLATSNLRDRLNRWENGNAAMYTVGETFTGGTTTATELVRRYIGDNALHAQFDFPLYWASLEAFARNGGGMGTSRTPCAPASGAYGDSSRCRPSWATTT
jgi:glycosidase